MSTFAVVIGAGVNALVAAHSLAQAGRRVLVLERRPGGSVQPDSEPGSSAAAPSALEVGWVPPYVVRHLELGRHGLRVQRPDPWLTAPLPDGGRLELWHDLRRSAESIRKLNPRDAARWPDFCVRLARLARLLEQLYAAAPPDPMTRTIRGLTQLGRLAWRARGLGRQGIEDLLRLLPMSVADLLDDWFECEALKGALAGSGVRNLAQGPRSGGTAFVLLHHHVGSAPGVFRPPLSNLAAVLETLPGVEIRWGAAVARLTVRRGRVAGLVLDSGEEIATELVLSGADPRHTLLDLVEPGWLDPEAARGIRHVRRRGVAARVLLALDDPPALTGVTLAPSLDDLERAWDDAKHGCSSRRPYVEVMSEAPGANGRSCWRAHVQYAPYAPADGPWDHSRRTQLGDAVVAALAEQLPEARGRIAARSVAAPPDLEAEYGWPEGQPHHAELALDQILFMRPTAAIAQYRTPIHGLYLCGPGTHPGGGIAGAAGMNAARCVLADIAAG